MPTYRIRWPIAVGTAAALPLVVGTVEELVLSGSTLSARDSRGEPTKLPPALAGHAATRGILVSLYDKRWRDGPIGAHLPNLTTTG